jgi:LPXTG-motif cell wall-anchored protein
MKRKWFWAIGFVLAFALALIVVAPSMAYYNTVSGELRDSKTGALWEYGGNVEVFHCSDLSVIATDSVDSAPTAGYGTFSIDISSISADTPLCIEVDFTAGPNGDPGNASKGPYADRSDDTGDLDTGVYFTGTGPTAINLQSFNTEGGANAMLPAVVGLLLLAGVSFVIIRRRQQA